MKGSDDERRDNDEIMGVSCQIEGRREGRRGGGGGGGGGYLGTYMYLGTYWERGNFHSIRQ